MLPSAFCSCCHQPEFAVTLNPEFAVTINPEFAVTINPEFAVTINLWLLLPYRKNLSKVKLRA
jgi:hypothetical protein